MNLTRQKLNGCVKLWEEEDNCRGWATAAETAKSSSRSLCCTQGAWAATEHWTVGKLLGVLPAVTSLHSLRPDAEPGRRHHSDGAHMGIMRGLLPELGDWIPFKSLRT